MHGSQRAAGLTLAVTLAASCAQASPGTVDSNRVEPSATAAPVTSAAPSPKAPTASARASAVSVDEVRDRVDEVAKQGRARVCERPVIHGPETPGRADDDIVSLFERELDDASLPAAVRRAISHRDACSPYLFGRREPPTTATPTLGNMFKFGKRLPTVTEQFASSADALAWVVDAIRLGQDLGRGGGAMLPTTIGASWATELVASSHELLERDDWSRPQLDATAAALDGLMASGWAPPAETVRVEGWYMVANTLQVFWPSQAADPTRALPPELRELPEQIRKVWRTDPPGEEGDVLLRAALRMMAEDELACPASAAPETCASGLVAVAERRKADRDRVEKALATAIVTPIPVPRDSAAEHDMQDIFIGARDINWRYVKLLLEAPIRVAALRLQVEQRRTGRCPTQADDLARGLELRPAPRGLEVWPAANFPKEMFSQAPVLAKPLVTLDCGALP